MIPVLLTFTAILCHGEAFANKNWVPLPHVERRDVLLAGASALTTSLIPPAFASSGSSRSVLSVDSHLSIPVWPTWGGGRVTPVSLGGPFQDPFLLLAHHDHWFDPRDPLRKPFKSVGKALSLPYVDVEGFSMHPHRGFDILTYVLDGSDGFRHRDSLQGDKSATGGSKTYRGGTAQWMRTGSGVMHEEFWETRNDRRTNIELFQLWINLPASQKFDPPAVQYIGKETESPWFETEIRDPITNAKVGISRDLGGTLLGATKDSSTVKARPPVEILHTKLDPGGQWILPSPPDFSALLYVRKGSAAIGQSPEVLVDAQQTATFQQDGDSIVIRNPSRRKTLDLLVLSAKPLQETLAQAGPIVMNTDKELYDAYQQLSDGTFLDRNFALQQQARRRG